MLQHCYLNCYNWLAFYHTGLYYEYRVAVRCGLTADSRLHITRVCGIDLTPWTDTDQTFTICTTLLTGHDAGIGTALRRYPPNKLSPAAAIVVTLNTEDIARAKYRSNNACVWRHGGALSPTGHISGPFKNALVRRAFVHDIVQSLGDAIS